MSLEEAQYLESLVATETSLKDLKQTLLSWPQHPENHKTQISSLHASIVELLCSMVDILDFEHEPKVEAPECGGNVPQQNPSPTHFNDCSNIRIWHSFMEDKTTKWP